MAAMDLAGWFMKKIICTLASALAALRIFAQGTLLVDQQSFDLATAITGTSISGIGQSFTPGFGSIDYVQFGVADLNQGSFLFVNLRQNSMSGPIIGSTDTQPVPLNNGHVPTTFLFSTSVALNPGTQYFLEPVIVVNAFQITILTSAAGANPYPGGTALDGNTSAGFDLWFAEGVVVPEPSTWALFGLGGVVLFAAKWRRWTLRVGS
jgi:hypothetical protein